MKSLAALALAALTLAGRVSAQILDAPDPAHVQWTQRLGSQLPLDARFTDQDGRSLALAECFGERPVVLALVYYRCPMLCGLVLEALVKDLRAVQLTTGQDFDVLVISFDHRETPALASAKRRSALEAYGLAPDSPAAAGWRFLVGAEDPIRAVADAVGFGYVYVPTTDEWSHAAGISVLTPHGVVSRVLFGVEFAPRDLRLALVEASQEKIGTLLDQVLLRCFHYDPTRGKYGFAVLAVVRFCGALTLCIVGAFVLRSLRRERRTANGAAAAHRGEPGRS